MRVLFDYRPALRERSGVGEYAHALAVALLRAGASPVDALDLTLFSSSWKDRFHPDAALLKASIVDRKIPVVAANRGALPAVLGDAGPLVDADDVDGFAEAIDSIISDSVAATSGTARGFERARLFRWDRTAARTLSACQAARARRSDRGAA